MNNIELDSGAFSFGTSAIPIESLECTTEEESIIELIDSCKEATFSARMSAESCIRFIYSLTGLFDTLYESCPNKRVVHLARYHKSPRIRKKNFKRIIRMTEKGSNA